MDSCQEREIQLNIIFWDIDGTLVRTGKAGLFAFAEATVELWGLPIDFAQFNTAGMTDYYIAQQIIEAATGRPATENEMKALSRRYEELLAEHLNKREGLVLPAVREILLALHELEIPSFLLTGNSRRGAELKLKKFDLTKYFDFELSAFCDDYLTRDAIAARALHTVKVLSRNESHKVFVIGDTPNDIRCGKDIGAYTIGVATGTFSQSDLAAHSPWWAVAQLPAAPEFLAKITEAEKNGPSPAKR